ncbi:hypothetical protein PF327_10800 [Sulfurovum sp. XTW-4]|uniref:Phage protein n=1 Tax=Sulfurovum xiamenensis TaxID=3019066 RepID=A0ABT7QUD4_9BACT|nr:hypothetical protein [Sulfurovum xiamenensis]MDM5264683.1 hypothetical protein [Sulfurovum xiamenensis]
MLSDDLRILSSEMIEEFGDTGLFVLDDVVPDSITGETVGVPSEVSVTYFREFYKTKDLIENLIIAGDAQILFVSDTKPKKSWKFKDSDGDQWSIIDIIPTEVQGVKVVYKAQVRK